jgi:hypothetical protein
MFPQCSIKLLSRAVLRHLDHIHILDPHISYSISPLVLELMSLLGSKSTLRSQLLAVEEEDEDTSDTQSREPSKQTHATSNSQAQEHWAREQDGCSCKRRSHGIVTGKQASSICRVDHGQIDEDTLEQDEYTNHIDDDTNTTDDPVNLAIASPGKDEQADGDQETGEESWDQSTFRSTEAVFADFFLHNVVEVGVVPCYRDDDADCNAEEDEAHFSDVESIALHVDQREDFEEGVEDCVTESDVNIGVGLGEHGVSTQDESSTRGPFDLQ